MDKPLPLVAIVTPVYNGSPWLERTMACVQRQTYGNIVHVLLDNASTDDTPEVIERFKGQKVPLKVARNEAALGQTANWNAAMKLTPPEAKYVMLLCADDLIRADAVEKLVARAEEDDKIVLVSAVDIMFDRVRAPVPPGGKTIVEGRDFVRAVIENTYNHYAWQLFFARWRPEDATEDYFSYTASSLDNDRLLKTMMTGKVGFVMEPLFYTRHHSGNMSAQFTSKKVPKFRLFRWETAVTYAHKVLDKAKAERAIHYEKRFVARFELIWRLSGAHEPANVLRDRLRSDGYPASPFDYVMSVLDYPFYKKRQARISAAANAKWPDVITEEAFAAFVPTRD